jgi:hypothetical protein
MTRQFLFNFIQRRAADSKNNNRVVKNNYVGTPLCILNSTLSTTSGLEVGI